MKLDLTITISVILAICAIISPIITTYMNNKHQLKIKEIEANKDFKNKNVYYIIDVLERYVKSIEKAIVMSHSIKYEVHLEYNECYAIALIYLPDCLIDKAQELNQKIQNRQLIDASTYADQFIIEIKKEILRLKSI